MDSFANVAEDEKLRGLRVPWTCAWCGLFVGSARAATHTERHPVENAVAVCAIVCDLSFVPKKDPGGAGARHGVNVCV